MKGEGRVGDRLNCDEEIGGTRLKCIHRVHGHLGARPVYSRFIRQDLFHGGGKGGQERNGRDVEERGENLHQQTCRLPTSVQIYKYIYINIVLWSLFTKIYQRSPSASVIVTRHRFPPRRGTSFEAETEGDEQGSRFHFLFTPFSSPSFSVVLETGAQNRKRQSRTPEASEAIRPRYFRRMVVIRYVRSYAPNITSVCYCFLSLSYD